MKKLISLFLFIILILQIPICSQAAMKLIYDGKAHTYTEKPVFLFVNGEQLKPGMPPILFGGTTVVPARAVFEKLGAAVTWEPKTQQVFVKSDTQNIILKINDQMVEVNGEKQKSDMPAKIINGSTMIPLRFVSEKLGMAVEWDSVNRNIKINSIDNEGIIIKSVTVNSGGGKILVNVEADGSINQYSKMELSSPDRLVIDFANSKINAQQCNIDVSDSTLQKIRASQYQVLPNKSRIVLDLVKKTNYAITMSEDKKLLTIGIETNSSNNTSEEIDNTSNVDSVGESDDFTALNENIGQPNAVKLINEDDKIGIQIAINNAKDCKVSRFTGENAIAVDNINTDFKSDKFEIPLTDSLIKSLRIQKLSDGTGRLIISTVDQFQYQVYQEPGSLTVLISKPDYKNISYKNYNGKASIIISADVKDIMSSTDNHENNSTVFSIPLGSADLGEGNMQINDDLIKSLEITSDSSKGSSVIANYNYSGDITYEVTKDDSNNTVINISKKDIITVPAGKFLVVVDAGHGGKDPGAKYNNDVLEKELNLDIAKKLNLLLRDAGIETIMTRDKDVFVELRERANIANRANADLFVSIHNNWINIPSYGGTMTLYYPSTDSNSGISSKRFADITQEEMLKTLGSVDRKTIPRPGLVVLNSTDMPAVLAEVGFISNEAERKKLDTSDYRTKAATGLYNAIIKALGEINKEN